MLYYCSITAVLAETPVLYNWCIICCTPGVLSVVLLVYYLLYSWCIICYTPGVLPAILAAKVAPYTAEAAVGTLYL